MLVQAEQQQQMMVIKGKRTKRARPASPLPPLITMSTSSSSGVDETARLATSSSSTTTTTTTNNLESGSHHLHNSSPSPTYTTTTQEEEDMAYCLILLAQGGAKFQNYPSSHQENSAAVYECKTCNRCFPSFQALGGHRASHKKPKASPQEPEHHQSAQSDKFTSLQGMGLSLQMACNSSNTLSAINFNSSDKSTKLKVHACGICGAEFSSGQALGGHMRRHRTLIAAVSSTPATQSAAAHEPPRSVQFCLDLNLPAEDEQEEAETPKFLFGSSDKTLVFTAGSLVDCRY